MRQIEFIPAKWLERSAGAIPPLVCYSRTIEIERRHNERRQENREDFYSCTPVKK